MSEFALRTLEIRRKAGLPYIDPDTGEPVPAPASPPVPSRKRPLRSRPPHHPRRAECAR
jgi:hypothetical protein